MSRWGRQRAEDKLDKHRFVNPVLALLSGSIWIAPGDLAVENRSHALGPFKDSAEVMRFVFTEPHPEVDMNFSPMINVQIGQRQTPASLYLREMIHHVQEHVLPAFVRFFPIAADQGVIALR